MNKVILGLILAVCVLGLALVTLNERLGRKPEPPAPPKTAENRYPLPQPPAGVEQPSLPPAGVVGAPLNESVDQPMISPIQGPRGAEALERAEAEAALAPPHTAYIPQPDPEPAVTGVVSQPAPKPPVVTEAPTPKPEPKAEIKRETRPETKPEAKAEVKPAPKPQPTPQQQGDKNITRFVVFSRDNGATIRLSGNGRLNYKNMVLENPDRVVVDLDGEWKFPPNPGIPKNDIVNSVRVGKLGDSKTRVVIDLKSKPKSARVLPAKTGDSIDVRVDK